MCFSFDLINNFANQYLSYGYINWLEEHVYSESNLRKYSALLKELKQYLDMRKIPFLFVMTPESHNKLLLLYFNKIKPLFRKQGIRYLDLYPFIKQEFIEYYYIDLGTLPSDGHPGNLITTVYAEEVSKYLNDKILNKW